MLDGDATYKYAQCIQAQAASCAFNGQTIPSGSSVTAYQAASVPSGSACVSQTRTCSNGSLNGSYSHATCAVAAAVAGLSPVAKAAVSDTSMVPSIAGLKQSDVMLSSRWERPETPQAVRDFFATRLDWNYSYESSGAFMTKVMTGAGTYATPRGYSGSINSEIPDGLDSLSGSFSQGRDITAFGTYTTRPEMVSAGAGNVHLGDLSSTAYQSAARKIVDNYVSHGARLIQVDDAGMQYEWALDPEVRGGYGYESLATFSTQWLPAHFSTVPTSWGLPADFYSKSPMDRVDLLRNYAATHGGTLSSGLQSSFYDFLADSLTKFWSMLRAEANTIAGANVAFSCNNTSYQFTGDESALAAQVPWHVVWSITSFSLCDLYMAEVADPLDNPEYSSAEPEYLWNRISAVNAKHKLQIFSPPKFLARSYASQNASIVRDTRRDIAFAYAAGSWMIVPWDVYVPSSQLAGTSAAADSRYFGKASEYADLYKFIRGNAPILDGYRHVFATSRTTNGGGYFTSPAVGNHTWLTVKGSSITVNGVSADPIQFTSGTRVYGFVRANPSSATAPAAVHLVTFAGDTSVGISLDNTSFGWPVGTPITLEVRTPSDASQSDPKYLSQTITGTASAYRTVFTVPMQKEYAILVVAPSPSLAPVTVLPTLTPDPEPTPAPPLFVALGLRSSIVPGVSQTPALGAGDLDASSDVFNFPQFGRGVAIDGNHIAIGTIRDRGPSGTGSYTGAVYLYTFDPSTLQILRLDAIVGYGYTGGKNVHIPGGEGSTDFGIGISLQGRKLAIGAPGADNGIGKVYLIEFADDNFGGGTLVGQIGSGVSGSKSLSLILPAGGWFGWDVSLSGRRLAVGASHDGGYGNSSVSEKGAAYVLKFSDDHFSNPTVEHIIGYGYNGPNDKNLPILDHSAFGHAVSLQGYQLLVSADKDRGAGANASTAENRYGAVFMFNIGGPTPVLRGAIGKGYTGSGDIDMPLRTDDLFGSSARISGNTIVVGATGDDGYQPDTSGTDRYGFGAVHILHISDQYFGGLSWVGRVGKNFTGDRDVPLSDLRQNDRLGYGVALNGNVLIAGAPQTNNSPAGTGKAYLLSIPTTPLGWTATTISTASCSNGLNITQYPSCVCPTGQTQSGSACVLITTSTASTRPALSLSITPGSVSSGSSFAVSWNAQNVASCRVLGPLHEWTGTSGSQSETIITQSAYPFILRCTLSDGQVYDTTQWVQIGAGSPPSLSIQASPNSVKSGASFTVSWSAKGLTSCHLLDSTGDNGVAAASSKSSTIYTPGSYPLTFRCMSAGEVYDATTWAEVTSN